MGLFWAGIPELSIRNLSQIIMWIPCPFISSVVCCSNLQNELIFSIYGEKFNIFLRKITKNDTKRIIPEFLVVTSRIFVFDLSEMFLAVATNSITFFRLMTIMIC